MIDKLLVANRGEIAGRVMRSARAMGITCVAVCSEADAAMPYLEGADEVVRLAGSAPADTYLRTDLLVDAARRTGAQAVHPGYGFLSENGGFAQACVDAGLIWVGPPPAVIEAMGSKLAAKATMAAAGVPVLPSVEVSGQKGDLARAVADLGWPVLVKASAGGGGRGMRVVHRPEDLAGALESAAREATSAFGDGTIFVEPYVERPRHVEVQILGDTHGTVVHLFERECSIQRRHQKIVEEAPSPAVDETLRAAMGSAAVDAALAIGYVNAGTVEFLLLPDGTFAFLEVNTRLQVEHPVTEAVTGLDLVRLQLLVADGQPLPAEVLDAGRHGHAIEVRLYAEDATAGWQPSAGRLHRFSIPTDGGVRLESGVTDGSEVGSFYDPMLAKVIAHAPSRPEAARVLASALARAEIHGVTTNRDLLVRILTHPEFLAGHIDTGFLERHDPAELGRSRADGPAQELHALTAALAAQARRRAEAKVQQRMPSGWRNNPADLQHIAYDVGSRRIDVAYGFDRTGRCAEVYIDGQARPEVIVHRAGPDQVEVSHQGVSRHLRVHQVGLRVWVDGPDGCSVLDEVERFPLPGSQLAAGSLVAPLPGTVVKVHVSAGQQVRAGDTLVAIEAMKMEHEVQAPAAGTVREIHVEAGDQVEAGRLLAVVDGPDD